MKSRGVLLPVAKAPDVFAQTALGSLLAPKTTTTMIRISANSPKPIPNGTARLCPHPTGRARAANALP
jgi:hypothetical protein